MCRSVTLTGLKNDAKPAMVCTANDLLVWKDFPRGLRVLLLDEDCDSAVEIRSKLEEMNYIVSTFCNESEARLAVSNKIENFHIAVVEVNLSNSNEIFKFLETAKELPTIMTSKIHCINTIMKCIALGAVEFLQKPLSEDKLRNIWQHVVHKAFNAKKSGISESLKPLQIQLENGESGNRICIKVENESRGPESNPDHLAGSDKFPAPSTPQIEQGGRLLVDGDCQDQTNCSSEKECGDRDGECKSVETTCGNSVAVHDDSCQRSGEIDIKEESDSADGPKSENNVSVHLQNKDDVINFGGDSENSTKMSRLQNSGGSKGNRKKAKVDWTPELHKKFVQAVEQLGIDQAVPSRILELMKVEGLTRHNVASHLQKYRMHQRHILPKVEDPVRRVYYPHKPIMPYPPYHSPHTFPTAQVYSYWGQPSSQQSGFQAWGPVGYSAWQPAETWHWNPYSAVHADAWGCPVMTTPHTTCSVLPQNSSGIYNGCGVDSSYLMPNFCTDLHPAEDEIDKVVQDAMNKPWLPLPLGLRPPSTDTILAELSKQGISTIPSHFINGSNLH